MALPPLPSARVPIKATWYHRRVIIRATLAYCALMVGYLAIWGKDTELTNTIAMGLILLAGSVIGSYVFGAVWDDKNARAASVESESNVLDASAAPAEVSVAVTGDQPTIKAG